MAIQMVIIFVNRNLYNINTMGYAYIPNYLSALFWLSIAVITVLKGKIEELELPVPKSILLFQNGWDTSCYTKTCWIQFYMLGISGW